MRPVSQPSSATAAPPTNLPLPQHLQDMDPIRQLALAPDSHRTPELIATLLPQAIARWRQEVNDQGRPGLHVQYGIARSGAAGLEALAPWLAETSGRTLVACMGGLSEVININRRALASGDIQLSTEASAAWRSALHELRKHVSKVLNYRLLLNVSQVSEASQGKAAKVTCYQGMFMGMAKMTPYTIAIRRDGKVPQRQRRRAWPVAEEALAGLHELLAAAEAGDWRAVSPGWVVVFESEHKEVEQTDWQDGCEQFTATRRGLTPGRVCEIRRQRQGDDDIRRGGLWPVLSESSALCGSRSESAELAHRTCEGIELLLGD